MEVHFEGNWMGVKLALARLPHEIRSSGIWGQRKVSEKLVKIVKKHINKQDLGWAPRSEKTKVGDSRVLVDTEQYYSSIKAWKTGDTYNAGVPTNAKNNRGTPLPAIAIIHEQGIGVPARPVWEPSFKELGGAKGIASVVTSGIFTKLAKLRALGFTISLGKL